MQNKNDVRVMLKEAGILFAITLIAGLILGFVYELTKGTIAEQEAQAQAAACKNVFMDATDFNETDLTIENFSQQTKEKFLQNGLELGKIYEACSDGQVLGYVIEVASGEGYGGAIDLYVGVRKADTGETNTINAVSILEISETVGLGMEAENILVPQFENKLATDFKYTKSGSTSDSEIDAISGATITTKAFVNAVNGAVIIAAEMQGN